MDLVFAWTSIFEEAAEHKVGIKSMLSCTMCLLTITIDNSSLAREEAASALMELCQGDMQISIATSTLPRPYIEEEEDVDGKRQVSLELIVY